MADAFGMTTVPEGVETEEQLAFLQQHGCDYAQGYLFSRPVPYPDFTTFSLDWTTRNAAAAVRATEPV